MERLHQDVARLSDEAAERSIRSLPGWRRDGSYIVKVFDFPTFLAGVGFVRAVARVAEAQGHHPDIHIVWTRVTLRITTHDEGGLTRRDFTLARAIENRLKTSRSPR